MPRNHKGFSLLELMVVLVIIGFISGLVVPRIGSTLPNIRLKTTARHLAAMFRYCSNMAMNKSKALRLVMDIDGQKIFLVTEIDFSKANQSLTSYLSEQEDAQAFDNETLYRVPDNVSILNVTAPAAIDEKQVSGLFSVLFFSNGSSTGAVIKLINSVGKSATVSAALITGNVTIDI